MSEKQNTVVKSKIDELNGLGLEIQAVSNYVYEAKNNDGQHFCFGLAQLEAWTVRDLYDTVVNYWKGCKNGKCGL